MPCRVGITTDPVRRKKEWESEYSSLRNWQTYGPYTTRQKAQEKENQLAVIYGCASHPGGREPDDSAYWYAYKFDHSGY